jgi:hypothetical protein
MKSLGCPAEVSSEMMKFGGAKKKDSSKDKFTQSIMKKKGKK